jgi:hypothetical protein
MERKTYQFLWIWPIYREIYYEEDHSQICIMINKPQFFWKKSLESKEGYLHYHFDWETSIGWIKIRKWRTD